MVLHLLKGETDLALSSEVDLPFKRQVVDYNLPTSSWKFAAFFRKPSFHQNKWAHLKPFQPALWLAIVGSIVTISLVLVLFQVILSWRMQMEIQPRRRGLCYTVTSVGRKHDFARLECKEESRLSLADCLFASFCILCAKGAHAIPPSLHVRIVFYIGSISGVVFITAYVGILHSFLSVKSDGISTFGQLLGSSYTLAIDNYFQIKKLLQVSPAEHRGLCELFSSLHHVYRSHHHQVFARPTKGDR